MCAVKLVYIGRDLTDLKTLEMEEKSYDPRGAVKGLEVPFFESTPPLREMAVVCTFNNKAGLTYTSEGNTFSKIGEPTEAALRVAAEKLGKYDSKMVGDALDYKKTATPYGHYLG
jgi:hypothetical protein